MNHHDQTECIALQAVLTVLEQQATQDADLRAQLAILGRMFLRMAEAPPMPTTEVIADHQVEAAPTPETVVTQQVVQLLPIPAPASPPATTDDLQRLVHFYNKKRKDNVVRDPDVVVVKQATQRKGHLDKLPDEATLLAQLSTACAKCAVQVREATTALPMLTANNNAWFATICTPEAGDPDVWTALGAAYDQSAIAAEMLVEIVSNPELRDYQIKGLDLLAEAQSALRAAAKRLSPRPEPNQEKIFHWLCRRAKADQIYLRRFMRIDDSADPETWSERGERIMEWRDTIEEFVYRRRRERKLLGKLRYQVGQSASGQTELWPRVVETLDALLALGIPASSRDLRTMLWMQRTNLAAYCSSSRSVALLLRAWERLPKTMLSDVEIFPETRAIVPDDAAITRIAHVLRGTTMVLIGGDERPHAAQTITEAFELDDLIWCDTNPHQSFWQLEPAITRPEVSVVILAIRWASHGLGDVQQVCDRSDKPLIRLPGGYNVGQLAYQISQQASDRLGIVKEAYA